ncbi:OsmC family protein [Sunxiuqinia rutila]|uniref:OsmC family protein n=1 Tax=Sunxiuqinia rutila TaxID=1397841 RepID=UPI003D36F4AA
MKSEELRKIQAPIKEKYREQPTAAIITLQASGEIGAGISCKVATGKTLVEAGLHPATGGNGMLACSGDLLLEALVACAGVTLRAVSTALEIPIEQGKVIAEGDMDFRGTLGVAKDVPVGFKAIRLSFELACNASPDQLAAITKLTERYCVVYQTLTKGVPIATSYVTH